MGTNHPQTADQINQPHTGQHFFFPHISEHVSFNADEIKKILSDSDRAQRVAKAGWNLDALRLAIEVDRLNFALQRIVNLLQHADSMMALQVAQSALNPNPQNEHE